MIKKENFDPELQDEIKNRLYPYYCESIKEI